jgi:hypothetical protein
VEPERAALNPNGELPGRQYKLEVMRIIYSVRNHEAAAVFISLNLVPGSTTDMLLRGAKFRQASSSLPSTTTTRIQ